MEGPTHGSLCARCPGAALRVQLTATEGDPEGVAEVLSAALANAGVDSDHIEQLVADLKLNEVLGEAKISTALAPAKVSGHPVPDGLWSGICILKRCTAVRSRIAWGRGGTSHHIRKRFGLYFRRVLLSHVLIFTSQI